MPLPIPRELPVTNAVRAFTSMPAIARLLCWVRRFQKGRVQPSESLGRRTQPTHAGTVPDAMHASVGDIAPSLEGETQTKVTEALSPLAAKPQRTAESNAAERISLPIHAVSTKGFSSQRSAM